MPDFWGVLNLVAKEPRLIVGEGIGSESAKWQLLKYFPNLEAFRRKNLSMKLIQDLAPPKSE